MEKWADYLISAVRYNSDSGGKIVAYLKVHIDNGDSVGESRTWSKEEILKEFSKGNRFATIFKEFNGKWRKGEVVSISQLNELFIRTDSNNIPEDYLEEIPEF